ncbi:ImmA/IrrE family metallo-endopeptidase [Alicyclobacillus acidocaldarius]|nr:ImmA/IrrE family metallo-endopeptidase [Alicyclobacillus acidocaldarius]
MGKLATIKRAVLELTSTFNTSDPYTLCELLEIEWRKVSLPGHVRGLYIPVRMHNKRYVLIHKDIVPSWQRFVCAHELGHHVLHGDLMKGTHIDTFTISSTKDHTEFEANAFATFLLMVDQHLQFPFPLDAVASASQKKDSRELAQILRDRTAEYC